MSLVRRLQVLTTALSVTAVAANALGYTLLVENAENGYGNVVDGTDASYSLIQSEIAAQGSYSFHLAHPSSADEWFVVDENVTIQPDTKLYFLNRLGVATPTQVARVQVSTNGGSTWPTSIYDQSGSDQPGEGSFSLKEVGLGSYAGQSLKFRFYYDFTGGSRYPQTTPGVGWYVDNIQVGNEFQKLEWSIGDPSPHAQQYLEYINRARADAIVEANRLATETNSSIASAYNFFSIDRPDIVEQFQWYVDNGAIARHAQPLAFQSQLQQAAELHTQDMFQNEFQGHNSSSNPPAPFQSGYTFGQRLDAVEYSGSAGENVFARAASVAHGHAGFDVDWGNLNNSGAPFYNPAFVGQGMQNPAGHRRNLHNPNFQEIGIGVVNGTNGDVGPQLVTQDFGDPGSVRYVTGVVFEDLNSNNLYDIGEGRSGVRVDINNSVYYALSTTSGGYAVPVPTDGTFNVTFSGGGFNTFNATAVVTGGRNAKIDYLVEAATPLWGDYNQNNVVDAADYVLWRKRLGVPGATLPNDNTNGVGPDDYTRWRQNFGDKLLGGATSGNLQVPEPTSGATMILVLGVLYLRLRNLGR